MRRALPTIIVVGIMLLFCWWLLRSAGNLSTGGIEPGSTYNEQKDGTAALQRWLTEIGYKTKRLEFVEWQFTNEQKILFIVTPQNPKFTNAEVRETIRWLNEGGTLIMVTEQGNALLGEFNIDMSQEFVENHAKVVQPLANMPVTDLNIDRSLFFETSRNDVAVLVGTTQQPLVLTFKQGQGKVYLLSSLQIVSNQGLLEEQRARFVLNLTGGQPEGTTIYFDEIHHGRALPPKRPPGPAQTYPPLVSALVYMALVIGAWALWSGRRFGTIMPTRAEVNQRSSAEYVQSMAELFQHGRQTGYILGHYKTAFKRRIAKPYGFNPKLADKEYINELLKYTYVDDQRLESLLNALSMPNPSEDALLKITSSADEFIRDLEIRH